MRPPSRQNQLQSLPKLRRNSYFWLQHAMRNNVTFRHPAEFIPVSEDDGILATSGADWFVSLLQRIDGLSVQSELCQEDWGVVVFAERAGKRFWIGLSLWPEDEQAWLAHFHHHSFAWLQRWSTAGKLELERFVSDFHSVVASEQTIYDVTRYYESDMRRGDAQGSATPNAVC